MAFQKKIWTDRVAEFINRRILTHEDGTEQIVTVARSEGTVSQEGDAFDAKNMNDLESRVEAAFEEVNESLNGLSFVPTTETAYEEMESHDANTLYIFVEETEE